MQRSSLVVCFLLCGFLLGCRGDSTTATGDASENLRVLARMFNQFASMRGGRGPKDEADLKKFMAARGMDEAAISAAFVSPRDNQPYVIRYGGTFGMPDPSSNQPWPVVAYEATGVDGSRQIAFFSGGVEVLTEEELRARVPELE